MSKFASLIPWALVSFGLTLALFNSEFGFYLENVLQRKVEYLARDWSETRTPKHPSLKIIALDDFTVAELQRVNLEPGEWIKLLSKISSKKPKAILIDKIFPFFKLNENQKQEIASLGFAPIYPIMAASSHEIPYLHMVNENWLREKTKGSPNGKSSFYLNAQKSLQYNYISKKLPYLYGPSKDFLEFSAALGSAHYSNYGYAHPFIQADMELVIPNVAIAFGNSFVLNKDSILVDKTSIYTNRYGLFHPDFLKFSEAKVMSLLPLLRDDRSSANLSNIHENDVVLLLPGFNSSFGDVKATPIGRMHGGMIVASAVNTFMQGRFIRFLDSYAAALIASSVIISLAITGNLSLPFSLFAFFCQITALVITGLATMSYGNHVIPWLFMGIGSIMYYIPIFTRKVIITSRQQNIIRGALENFYSKDQIDYIMKNSKEFFETNKSLTITVMFVDIVDFSRFSEEHTPSHVFQSLEEFMRDMKETIHKYDGIVNKTYGDGFFCVFSSITTNEIGHKNSYVDRAFECAIEIMQNNILKAKQDPEKTIFPLRCGLNTGTVYYGNLGTKDCPDLTYIGHAVNLGKRMESACDHFKILLSSATRDLLGSISQNSKLLTRKYTTIKHLDKAVEAWEYDPLLHYKKEVNDALRVFNKAIKVGRGEERWLIPQNSSWEVRLNDELTEVINISRKGFCTSHNQYYGRNLRLTAFFKHSNGYEYSLICEVKWGSKEPNGKFIHGLEFQTHDQEQHDAFIKKFATLALTEERKTS